MSGSVSEIELNHILYSIYIVFHSLSFLDFVKFLPLIVLHFVGCWLVCATIFVPKILKLQHRTGMKIPHTHAHWHLYARNKRVNVQQVAHCVGVA